MPATIWHTHEQRVDVCVLVGREHQRQATPRVLDALQLLLNVELLLGPVGELCVCVCVCVSGEGLEPRALCNGSD